MRQIVFIIIFLFIYVPVHATENIYVNSLRNFIKTIIHEQELAHLKNTGDSIYHHTLLFESNDMLHYSEKIDVVEGYKIVQIETADIKDYLDTCRNGMITIYVMREMWYRKTSSEPFCIPIQEVVVIKTDSYISFDSDDIHLLCYTYDCNKNAFTFKYCGTEGCNFYDQSYPKRKGWLERSASD